LNFRKSLKLTKSSYQILDAEHANEVSIDVAVASAHILPTTRPVVPHRVPENEKRKVYE
jgi:hypothetical protein